MTPLALLILLAIGTAAGLTLVVAAFVPFRPRLSDVLRDRDLLPVTAGGLANPVMQLAGRLRLTVPDTDLDLVGLRRESFVLQRIGFALGGALWMPLLAWILELADVAPPLFLTGMASLGAAFIGWTVPPMLLKGKVTRARAAFKGALASYCQLVALGRLGDRGPAEAMRYPALLGSGWGFRRIQIAIDEAALRGEMPWEGLQRLAESMGVRELKDLGHIITNAGQGGASIVDTLRAKASSLAQQQLAAQKAGSSIRSDRMDMPVAVMGLAFIGFLAFPGIYTLLGG
ncbi:type II secretion system protein [Amycolatopsis sp. NPDC059657]|uniref:type II secretion system protein n=1 Tax=Amycolatopsis sp. NPDC059657 TaxID=3346899 RepID=UPI00366F7DB8